MIDTITALQDPCPLPGTETDGDGEVVEGKKIRRHLNDKETLLYAPMSNIGNVIFDKDAMYINLKTVNFSKASDVSQVGRRKRKKRKKRKKRQKWKMTRIKGLLL